MSAFLNPWFNLDLKCLMIRSYELQFALVRLFFNLAIFQVVIRPENENAVLIPICDFTIALET